MGNRVTVTITGKDHDAPINLYAHWAGSEVYPVVQEVLSITDRLGDSSYLTAQIIHAVFTQLGYDGRSSFGVWAGERGESWDDNPTMYVDTDSGEWKIGDGEWHRREDNVGDVSF